MSLMTEFSEKTKYNCLQVKVLSFISVPTESNNTAEFYYPLCSLLVLIHMHTPVNSSQNKHNRFLRQQLTEIVLSLRHSKYYFGMFVPAP